MMQKTAVVALRFLFLLINQKCLLILQPGNHNLLRQQNNLLHLHLAALVEEVAEEDWVAPVEDQVAATAQWSEFTIAIMN
jgi:hypothetical protein